MIRITINITYAIMLVANEPIPKPPNTISEIVDDQKILFIIFRGILFITGIRV
jgi:hypothetical protein